MQALYEGSGHRIVVRMMNVHGRLFVCILSQISFQTWSKRNSSCFPESNVQKGLPYTCYCQVQKSHELHGSYYAVKTTSSLHALQPPAQICGKDITNKDITVSQNSTKATDHESRKSQEGPDDQVEEQKHELRHCKLASFHNCHVVVFRDFA